MKRYPTMRKHQHGACTNVVQWLVSAYLPMHQCGALVSAYLPMHHDGAGWCDATWLRGGEVFKQCGCES